MKNSRVFIDFLKYFFVFWEKLYIFAVPNRGVEQSVARRAHNPEVVGSSPASATTKQKVSLMLTFVLSGNEVMMQKNRVVR